MASKEFSLSDVSEHSSKNDLYLVVHDKVYDCGKFVDEHPGGEEVMLDVGGQDATEAFEDVGHSDEAREILNGMLVGNLKREAGDPAKPDAKTAPVTWRDKPYDPTPTSGGRFVAIYLIAVFVALGAFAWYFSNNWETMMYGPGGLPEGMKRPDLDDLRRVRKPKTPLSFAASSVVESLVSTATKAASSAVKGEL